MANLPEGPPPPNYVESTLEGPGVVDLPLPPSSSPKSIAHVPPTVPPANQYTEPNLPTYSEQGARGATATGVDHPPPMYMPREIPQDAMPNDYLILSIVVCIVCTILNITTLCCTIPAVMQARLAYKSKRTGELVKARYYSELVFGLILVSLLWIMFCVLGITAYFMFRQIVTAAENEETEEFFH